MSKIDKCDKKGTKSRPHYMSQLNKNLEDRMEELTRRTEEIHASSKKGLYTQTEEEDNQTNRRDDAFETRRTSRREAYQTLEYDE
jgi:hypothetical protein